MTNSSIKSSLGLQIVTQLEPAGAQSLAHWLESTLGLHTIFLYDKHGSDLFPATRAIATERPRSPLQFARMLSSLTALLRNTPQNAVIVAHTHFAIAIVALLAPRRSRVIAVHHWPEDRYPKSARLGIALARSMHKLAFEVHVARSVAPIGASCVIENPVPDSPREKSRQTNLSRAHRATDLLIVARHATEKNIAVALQALTSLPERRLTLVGTGPDSPDLVELAQKLRVSHRVDFLGKVPHDEVLELMTEARALLLPSLWEALPMALLEAVSMGTPMVVSNISAHSPFLEAGAALGHPPLDSDALARAVLQLSDPEVQASLADGRATLKVTNSASRIRAQWETAIEVAVGRHTA